MAIRSRDERIDDLYMEDRSSEGNPAEEGLVRYVSGDIVAYVGGQVKSLTQGAGSLPTPLGSGGVLFSIDGANYVSVCPIVSCDGWLSNWDSELLVEGLG